MNLTTKQQRVVRNAAAWCNGTIPTDNQIQTLLNWVDKGIKPNFIQDDASLIFGWNSHYGDEFDWIKSYEEKGSNWPAIPPQAWIYNAYYSKGKFMWDGWLIILLDFFKDSKGNNISWERVRPAYVRAYTLACYYSGYLNTQQLKSALKEQKS